MNDLDSFDVEVGTKDGRIAVDFTKAVQNMRMTADQAEIFAQTLLQKVDIVRSENKGMIQ